jgi:hypothetical protein
MTYEQQKWRRILETDKKSSYAAQFEMTRFLDKAFTDDHMDIINVILKECKVENISTPLLITILSSTLPAKYYIKNRKDFYERVKLKLSKDHTTEELTEILRGLE